MTKEKTETKEVAKVDPNMPVSQWNAEKWKKVKQMFFPTCKSDLEIEMFCELAKAYDLNPFLKQIWAIPFKKWNKETQQQEDSLQVFCGRDGFLSIAHKSGMYNGMETNFGYNNKGELLWAETTVWNKSCEHPTKCKVFLKEYTTGRGIWNDKRHVMLSKCSESSALRRAFNISGLYSPEEFREEEKVPVGPQAQITNNQSPLPNANEALGDAQRPNNLSNMPAPQQTIDKAAEILDAEITKTEVVDDNKDNKRGNFDIALRTIENVWDINKLERFRKALNKRAWSPEEAKFLVDAATKQQEKIVSQRTQGDM